MFGREYGAPTSRTGLQRLGKDDPRHPSRDEEVADTSIVDGVIAESVPKHTLVKAQPLALLESLEIGFAASPAGAARSDQARNWIPRY